jgi:Putative peptidoglycan binding domain
MRRVAFIGAGVAAVVALVIVPLALAGSSATARGSAASRVSTSSAAIVRTDLATTTQAAGTLGYVGSYAIVNQTEGRTITALPAAGARLTRGDTVYEVDGDGIPLLYGPRPMWRDLQPGVVAGLDVAQLVDNLLALGYTNDGLLAPGDEFTWNVEAALEAWQGARGLPPTGVLHVGDVVFEPGPLRVSGVVASLGAPAQPGGAVLQATSPAQDVVVAVPVTNEYLAHVGDPVTVTLPDGKTTTPGTISTIGSTAAGPPTGSSGPGPSSNAGPNNGSIDTVDVTIALTDPAQVAQYTGAAVTVNITSARAQHVLAVPINALLALAEGGYAVEIEDRAGRHLASVHTGLFSNSLVEVTGGGLRVGMRVEVPSS